MKVVNKIMIGIAVLCLLLCGGILVFALNPDMTSSLAQKLYGNTVDMPPGTEETGEGQTSGNGNISVTLPNGMPGEMNGYAAPSMDQMQIPVRIPADLCQRTEPDGKVCTGEDRVCQ